MPHAPSARDPVALLALALAKGEPTIASLAALAHGQTLPEGEVERLRRIGLIEAGPPRLDPRLFAPILALEAALGLAGEETLNQLLGLLRGAGNRAARDSILAALAEELHRHIDILAEGVAPTAELLEPILSDLQQVVARLHVAEADPILVTRVAELAARLIERLARQLRVGRRPRRERDQLPDLPLPSLAAALGDLHLQLPHLLPVPSAQAIARAVSEPEFPAAGESRSESFLTNDGRSLRRTRVGEALLSPEPLHLLYRGQELPEALRCHSTLTGLGREALESAKLDSLSQIAVGPAPLAWSTRLVSRQRRQDTLVA